MEPIPETVEAARALRARGETDDLVGDLVRLADEATVVVPDLVGVSVARLEEGLTFTVVASGRHIAILDAVQYLDGGPCVTGAETGRTLEFRVGDPMDEHRWRLFAEVNAAHTVRSTLTLPVGTDGVWVGSVNLYAASRNAFVGHHEQLAAIFGAWAGGAVANADLAFATRDRARATPDRIRELSVIDEAIDLLADRFGGEVADAHQRLWDAAARAGVSVTDLARFLIRGDELKRQHDEGPATNG